MSTGAMCPLGNPFMGGEGGTATARSFMECLMALEGEGGGGGRLHAST